MSEFLNDMLSQKSNILTQDMNLRQAAGLQGLTLDNIDEMSKEQKVALVFDLLKQI